MGREVRRVHKDWVHPKDDHGYYIPLSMDDPTSEGPKTHYQMYEDTTEGTPISPIFDSPEKLARWLADNNASASGKMTASYEAWLNVCRGKSVCEVVITGYDGNKRQIISGVEATLLPK